jgi:HSP20 family protein
MLARRNQKPVVSSLFDDFLSREFGDSFFNNDAVTSPSSNVKELDDKFEIEVAVPGFKKSDININVEDDILHIESEVKNEDKKEEDNFLFHEFSKQSFHRSFRLSNKVDSEKIDASYEDGILKVNIPKKEESKIKKMIKIK